MTIPAKKICDLLNGLNGNDDGFLVGLLARFYVTDELAIKSKVNCSKLEGAKYYSSSALGIVNALCDEVICYDENCNEFMSQSDFKVKYNHAWDKYESDIETYNKENGTNEKADQRPDYLAGE